MLFEKFDSEITLRWQNSAHSGQDVETNHLAERHVSAQ